MDREEVLAWWVRVLLILVLILCGLVMYAIADDGMDPPWQTDIPTFLWMCNTWQPANPGASAQRLTWFRLWGHVILRGPNVDIEAAFARRLYDFDGDGDVDLRDFAALQRTVEGANEGGGDDERKD